MKVIKLLLILMALFLMILGGMALYGFFFILLKWAVILGVIALAGVGAYKLFTGPDKEEQAALSPAEVEMMKAERLLAEIRRKELSK